MWQYFLHCNQNTVCMTKCSGIDFMELSFLVVNFVMWISGPELERFILWTSLKYQSLRRCYRCGASFGGAILLQVSIILLANGKINVLSERRAVIKHRPTRNIPEFILFTYLLTKCEQSPSWEANRSSAIHEFLEFYDTRKIITAFTSVCHLCLSWSRSNQPTHPFHFLKIHFNIILPYAWVFQVGSFLQAYPPKSCTHLSSPPIRATC